MSLEERFGVKTPYISDLVDEIRSVNGRYWHKKEKIWSFPVERFFEVVGIIENYLPNLAKTMRTSKKWEYYRDLATEINKELEESFQKSSSIEGSSLIVPVPKGKGLKYDPYQIAAVNYARNKKSVLLGDEMGLGKSIESIGIVNYHNYTKIIVICPNNLKINWKRELNRWLVNKDVKPIIISSQTDLVKVRKKENFVYVINYEILKKFSEELLLLNYDCVIVDEAHKIKNPKTIRTKETRKFVKKAKEKVLFLTGTPILNKIYEVFHIVNALRPDIWKSFYLFDNKFCKYRFNGFGKEYIGGKNQDKLNEELRKYVMIRRRKADVMTELPPKRRQIIEIPCDEKRLQNERKILKDKSFRSLLDDVSSEEDYNNIVKDKSSNSFKFFDHVSKVRHETALKKVPQVVDFVRNEVLENKDKVLIFAHHQDVLAALYDSFKDMAVTLTGTTKEKDRQVAVDKFQEDPETRVFIGGIIPAGVGITLTAADTVVFAELDWTPGNLSQAEDRVHRKGQKNSVTVYHVVLENSIDYYLAKKVINKQEDIRSALD